MFNNNNNQLLGISLYSTGNSFVVSLCVCVCVRARACVYVRVCECLCAHKSEQEEG